MRGIATFLFSTLFVAPALALESAPVTSTRTTATLVSDTDAVQAGKSLRLGLRLRLKPGWHTYWRNPGDAGVAPELRLTLPDGAAASGIDWPVPVRQVEGPLVTYAYAGDLVLPLTVTPGDGPLAIEASATWLVCATICVPEEGVFTLNLATGDPAPSSEAALFTKAAARLPRNSPFDARIAADGTLSLSGTGLSRTTVQDAWFFPDKPGVLDHAAPVAVQIGDGVVRLSLRPGAEFMPSVPLEGVVVLQDVGGRESYLTVVAAPGGPAGSRAVPMAPLWQTLILAMAGGLTLNLMPCVFPILAMKALGLARLSNQARRVVQAHAASYTAGVLAAFGGLAGLLLASRAAGDLVGWGFQFQSPVFVAAMAWVLFGIGLNLSGLFQVGAKLAGTGQGLARQEGHLGSFSNGVLAVVVAAPCTAPFMGAAVAVALSASPPVTIAVFLSLGLGLAMPYAILTLIPGLARLLPRPGRWMGVFKGALAFPMYGSAAWLVWVVSLQAGPEGVLATAAGMVLIGFAAWSYGLAQSSGRRTVIAIPVLALFLAGAVLFRVHLDSPQIAVDEAGVERFTSARLAALRAEGRPVFVNMTAAWCVSCLVNERIALSPAKVRQAFANHHVAYLKGDWTRADPAITTYLREHERDGVPLYILYPPGNARPTILPQILTEGEVLSQLDKLGV